MFLSRPLSTLLAVGIASLSCGATLLQGQASAPAQSSPSHGSPAPAVAASAASNLVSLPVIVRDKKGHLIQNLTRADFDLKVDGRAHVIVSFAPDPGLPLTVALDIDTSRGVQTMLDPERTASKAFFAQILTAPEDKAALLHFDREVELLKDLTANKSALTNALDELGPTAAPGDPEGHKSGATLYDSIYLAAHDVLAEKPGRKALIVLSDGQDGASQETLRQAVEAAERAQVVVYAVYYKGENDSSNADRQESGNGGHRGGLGYPGGGGGYPGGGGMGYPGGGYPGGGGMGYPGGGYPGGGGGQTRRPTEPRIEKKRVDGKKIMEQIADETGGDFFEIRKKENYAEAYSQIADELRQQYRLSFTPGPSESRPGFHSIDLRPHKGDQYALTPRGYYGNDSGGDDEPR